MLIYYMCSAFFVPLSFSHYIVCLSFFCIRLLITPLLPSNFLSFVSKWSSSVYGFWLPLCYLQTFCPSWVSDLLLYTASDYPFAIFKPSVLREWVSDLLLYTASDYPFAIFKPSVLREWVSDILLYTASDYPFAIFKPSVLRE